MKHTQHEIRNLDELKKFCELLSKELCGGDIVLLKGKVGAGKTQTVKYLVETLGGSWVSSPSFAIHQRYLTNKMPIDHVDIYRVKNDVDLESTGFWDLVEDESALLIVEWADRFDKKVWPVNRNIIEIHIEVDSRNMRKISIN